MMFRHFVENKRYRDFDLDVESAMIRMKKLGYTDAHFYTRSDRYEAFCKFTKDEEHDMYKYIYLFPDGSIENGLCAAWEDEDKAVPEKLSHDELKEINAIFKSIKWCPWEGVEGVEDHVEDS